VPAPLMSSKEARASIGPVSLGRGKTCHLLVCHQKGFPSPSKKKNAKHERCRGDREYLLRVSPRRGGGTTRGFRYMAFVGGLGLMKSPSQITTTQQHAIDTELTSRDVAVIP